MKKNIQDLINGIIEKAASSSYMTMMEQKKDLEDHRRILGGQFDEILAKSLVDTTEKEFYNAVEKALDKIDELNLKLKQEDITYLIKIFNKLATDMASTMRSVYHQGKYITELETIRIRFKVCEENLIINSQSRIEEYRDTKKNRQLTLADKQGYVSIIVGIAGIIIGFVIAKFI